MRLLAAALFLAGPLAFAQDLALAPLSSALTALRPHRDEHRETRGATPALTVAKHQLRDWIESHLASFAQTGDDAALEQQLHAALRDAQLLCEGPCFSLNSTLGYLDEVRIRREQEFLIVQTSVGIWCGYDDSGYVYKWSGRWQRVWQTEQNIYTEKRYRAQSLFAIHISGRGLTGRLILTLGAKPGCSAAFLPVYYRVFEWLDPQHPRLVLDRAEMASQADVPPIKGEVNSFEARLEFTAGGTGYGFGHQATRHFIRHGGFFLQTEPLAPAPRDFVEEWLSARWKQAAPLAESPALEPWHRKFHREDGQGDFPDPTLHCQNDPDLWQVALKWHDIPGETYYLVRWKQPDHFTIAAIADHSVCVGRVP